MTIVTAPATGLAGLLALLLAATLAAVPAGAEVPEEVTLTSGGLVVGVSTDPFALTVADHGEVVLDTAEVDLLDPSGEVGPLGFAVGAAVEAHQLGYGLHEQLAVRWFHATRVTDVDGQGPALTLTLATDDPTGRTITLSISERAEGVIELAAELSDTTGVIATGAAFDTDVDQRFLGLGERSDGVDQTGRQVVSWSEEGPFSAGDLAPLTDPIFGERWQGPAFFPGTNYPVPWVLSSRGYGVLLDSDWLNGFDLAATRTDVWTVQTREPALRLRVYGGPTPAEVLQRFTADTGRQPEPVEWFFGPWVQPGPDQEFWREADIPITVAQTYRHYLPCAAQSGQREQARANAERWHALGYRITTYVNSFVCNHHRDGAYAEGDAQGYFIQHPTGGTYPVPYVAYVGEDAQWHGVVDFTNPEATRWWQGLIHEAIEDGFDGWMEDFGEYVPVDAVTSDGRTGLQYHNRYCSDYHRASDEWTRPIHGDDFAAFVRCGYTGTAPYARLVWGADPSEDFSGADGLAAAVSQGQSMGLSGIAYWGSDIGGFHAITHTERTDAELQSRWVQYGAFSGIMRTQTTGYPRPGPSTYLNERDNVWDDSVREVWRRYTKLRTQLFPEVWQAAQAYQDTGMPIIRHLALHWPEDPEVYAPGAEYEFMFGEDLLVAPVVTDGARTREVYLPAGEWVAFWDAVDYDEVTGDVARSDQPVEVLEGGRYLTVDAPLEEIPLFVRADACLDILPADTDTIADIGPGGVEADVADVVQLSEALPRAETLDFGGC